jgi:tetratricopeptide (TPR) repeat protein/tRNA A-37 threonylcarbamoyl transferase component Bud32
VATVIIGDEPAACPNEQALCLLAEGSLGDAEREQVIGHLSRCESCRLTVSALTSKAESSVEALSEARRPLRPGARVGRYTLIRFVGAGAMGEVWSASDDELNRTVAIKVLRLAREAVDGAMGNARLRREAQAMAKLSHPNVVSIYELGVDGERVFCAMELVDGVTLGAWLQTARTWAAVATTMLEAGEGLLAAHRVGLVHRDFKPDNVLIERNGRVRVGDFGLASVADPTEPWVGADARRTDHGDGPSSQLVTATGTMLGTPGYMAPEQLEAARADAKSDQFAFCVTTFEALYGRRPFAGRTVQELLSAIRAGAPTIPQHDRSHRRVPLRLRRALARGLCFESKARFESMTSLLAEFQRALGRRPVWPAAAAASVALLVVMASWWWLSGREAFFEREIQRMAQATLGAGERAALAAAFAKSTHPASGELTERVLARLDAISADWVAMRIESWKATEVRREQSTDILQRRASCLDRVADELGAVVRLFASADRALVERAVDVVSGVKSVQSCADRENLESLMELPSSAQARREVRALERELAESKAEVLAGRGKRVLPRLEALDAKAQLLNHAPLTAESTYSLGSLQEELGRYSDAEATLRRGVQTAATARHHLIVAECWNRLLLVIGLRLNDYKRAMALEPAARAAVAQAGGWPAVTADFEQSLGALAQSQAAIPEAAAHYEKAVRLYREAYGENNTRVGISELNLGGMYIALERLEEAQAHLETALRIERGLYGDKHVAVAAALSNLGIIARQKKNLPEAERLHREALAIRREVLGETHAETMKSYVILSKVLRLNGNTAEARRMLELGIAADDGSIPKGHPQRISLIMELGLLLMAQDEWLAASAQFENALELGRDSLPEAHPKLVTILANLAEVRGKQGRAEEGLSFINEAISSARKGRPVREAELAEMEVLRRRLQVMHAKK